jgi:hypothetical protein
MSKRFTQFDTMFSKFLSCYVITRVNTKQVGVD